MQPSYLPRQCSGSEGKKVLAPSFILHQTPGHLAPNNGSSFAAKTARVHCPPQLVELQAMARVKIQFLPGTFPHA
jgi:hypothetical protein